MPPPFPVIPRAVAESPVEWQCRVHEIPRLRAAGNSTKMEIIRYLEAKLGRELLRSAANYFSQKLRISPTLVLCCNSEDRGQNPERFYCQFQDKTGDAMQAQAILDSTLDMKRAGMTQAQAEAIARTIVPESSP